MGGMGIATGTREAASALRWWLEMGVDTPIQEIPRNWLDRSASQPPETALPQAAKAPAAPAPTNLAQFQQWLAGPEGPLASARSRPVLPVGATEAEVMLLFEPPGREEIAASAPVGGEAAELMRRMLQAIGMDGKAYSANLACFHSPGARLSPEQLAQCAAAARLHVALARPKRLLLLGDAPCRALLGKALLQARGHVHVIEGIRTIASFHPRHLLQHTTHKRLAWEDLLLFTEEPE